MKIDVFCNKSDIVVRTLRSSILCTPADSSDETRLMYSTLSLCVFASKYDIKRNRHRIKQSVVSVAFKTILETRVRICIYETSVLHRRDDYIDFTSSCHPHILQQYCAHYMTDMTSYRPVAFSTVVLKLLEHFILSSISPFLGPTDNQFGFKADMVLINVNFC